MIDLFSYIEEEEKKEIEKPIPVVKKKKEKTEKQIFSVLEITKKIKGILEPNFSGVWIEGEISNHKHHSSGHHYFSLKDDKAVISCVMWRSTGDRLNFRPENGQKVIVLGNITVYEGSGRYQIDVKKMTISGIGELQEQFELLKQKLLEEGLFSQINKKALPFLVKNVGVITAETGAAFQDIRKVIRSRAPFVNISIYNARVQGKGTESEIVAGIELFNSQADPVDVLIIGRGGGSLEDLWTFNEEVVARAIFNSKIPIISAVGHEIDFSISDFVADVRAATPSHAAEIATINLTEENMRIGQYKSRLDNSISNYFQRQNEILNAYENSHAFKRPADILNNYTMVLDNIEDKFSMLFKVRFDTEKQKLSKYDEILRSLNPDSVLNRGFAIIRDKKTETILSSAKKVKKDAELEVQFKDGKVNVKGN
ncbi:MAG: exodeoxyribonuclease VII large subunit [Candidatus Delongbacteria bacterium]|nr:exodeoxyribonuclease VII large subunit [Candidatus Delongbacteria bacterium]